jgi:capsular polysaccharide export protein
MNAFTPQPVRRFLIVSAPFGGFARALADQLRQAGAVCRRVLLNGGDLLEWGTDEAVIYRGDLAAWPAWLADYMAREGVTDILTHGDSQPYAAAAIAVARKAGVAVHVTEQGYFRPHWVTLERDGVNGRSRLPRDPAHYLRAGEGLKVEAPVPVGRITPAAVRHIAAYHLAVYLAAPLFPSYRAGYQHPAAVQAFGHARRYLLHKLRGPARAAALEAVTAAKGDLHLVLLQRPGDSQLLQHSPYGETSRFIADIVDSFARHAGADARLLFKAHPLDHGLQHHARVVRQAAARAGVEGRVSFADDGHFPSLIARSASVISVNSSGGLAALEASLPTLVLVDEIYDMPGLTHQEGLDSFWTDPQRPDPVLFDRYRAVVMACTQVNGAFSTRHGVALAAPVIAGRLLRPSIEWRLGRPQDMAQGVCEPGDAAERRLAAVGGR